MLRRFGRDRRGVAAVEFALIAPVMILLYCGLAELTMAMMAERRAAHAASVVADLVAQSTQMDATQMADIFTVANTILSPFPTGTLKLRVSSVKADANGVPQVVWSQTHGLSAMSGVDHAVPANLLLAGDSVIQADVSYTYTSPIQQTMPNPLNYSETFFLKPRRTTEVLFTP